MSTYEVLYNSCYGGFDFPDTFLKEVFRRYPPESEEGKQLWNDTCDHFIQADDPVPVGKWTHRIVKTEEFCNGYQWIYYERLDKNGEPEKYQCHIDSPSMYCTKDFKTYYFVRYNHARVWRTLPAIIAMSREYNFIHTKKNHTELRIARVPIGYEFRIQEYDGMECVRVTCPTETIITDLLQVIRTGNKDNIHVLTQRLLDNCSYKEILYPQVEHESDSE
jgi:hypothetical protein